jgi:hypothetical protein
MLVLWFIFTPIIMFGCIVGTYHFVRARELERLKVESSEASAIVLGIYRNRHSKDHPDDKYDIQQSLSKRVDAFGANAEKAVKDYEGNNVLIFNMKNNPQIKMKKAN